MAFFGYPRGHRVNTETSCVSPVFAYQTGGYSPSNRALRESIEPAQENAPAIDIRFSSHAQAACCFSSSGLNAAPFFQTVKAIAAIFRANVRRAIDGFIPFASKFL